MDSYETILFSEFTSNDKIGTSNRLSSEPCSDNETRKEKESTKPMKYYTTDFFKQDCEFKGNNTLLRGINFSDGYGPSGKLSDLGSEFRIGGVSDNRCNGDLPSLPLPTTASFKSGQGDVDVEDTIIRSSMTDHPLKSANVKETNFYDRSFSIFTGDIRNPMSNVDYIVSDSPRSGISTKGTVSKKYTRGNGC